MQHELHLVFISTQVKNNPLARKKNFFYQLSADGTFHFSNGDIIRVNKAMLGFHSYVFSNIFYGSSSKSDITINDFDSVSFRIFLDCLLGFEKYTETNARLIYPIALKFDVEKSFRDCINVLTPSCYLTDMDENVIVALNFLLLYNCTSLSESILKSIKNKCGILNLFEQEDYYLSLEPASMLKIIENISEMNSFFLKKIFKWGEHYLAKQNKTENTICSFLSEHNILTKIPSISFESVAALFEFHNIISQKRLYTSDQILQFLDETSKSCTAFKFPSQSSWVKISKGEVLKEKINFQYAVSSPETYVTEMNINVWRNDMICNNSIDNDENHDEIIAEYDICFYFKNQKRAHNRDYVKSKSIVKTKTVKIRRCKRSYMQEKIENLQCSITALEVVYRFHFDCRILKASLDTIPFAINDNQLYFTCCIEFPGAYKQKK